MTNDDPNPRAAEDPSRTAYMLTARLAVASAIIHDPENSPEARDEALETIERIARFADEAASDIPEHQPPETVDTEQARVALARLHRRVAQLLDPVEPDDGVAVSINRDIVADYITRSGQDPADQYLDAVMFRLRDLWDWEHLESIALRMIDLAVQETSTPG